MLANTETAQFIVFLRSRLLEKQLLPHPVPKPRSRICPNRRSHSNRRPRYRRYQRQRRAVVLRRKKRDRRCHSRRHSSRSSNTISALERERRLCAQLPRCSASALGNPHDECYEHGIRQYLRQRYISRGARRHQLGSEH